MSDASTRGPDAWAETQAVDDAGAAVATSTDVEVVGRDVAVLPEGTRIDRFVVIDCLGAGGFSMVYRAFDPQLNRVIAIKLLRPARAEDARDEGRRERLLREAQALARVSHPNVVAVHDVGTYRDEVFVAMELSEGWALSEWVNRTRPSLRDIVRTFCGACDGLAAAHDADLVHRDVKPANMIVGERGHVKVVDFGLARAASEYEAPRAPISDSDIEESSDRLASEITRAGVLLGTPAYMSPEQLMGEPATAASDQYGLCVSLYEALYGEQPVPGATAVERRRNAIAGDRARPRAGSRVSRRLRAIVLRGMQPLPGQRYASIRELADELRDFLDGRRRTRWIAASAAVGIVALGAAVLIASRAPSQVCTGGGDQLAALWDAPAAAAVRARFDETGKLHAAGTYQRVASGMADYRAAWLAMYSDSCRATRVYATQSEAALDRRMACLERKRDQAAQLVALFRGPAAAEVIDDAAPAVRQLSLELAACADAAEAEALAALPETERARHDRLQRALDSAVVLSQAGRYADALALAKPVAEDTAALPRITAEADALVGAILSRVSSPDESAAALRRGLQAAARAGDDTLRARLWVQLVTVVGEFGQDHAGGEALLFSAELAVTTAGDERLRVRWLMAAAGFHRVTGDFDSSRDRYQQALRLLASLEAPDPLDEAGAHGGLALTLIRLGQVGRAREAALHGYEILRQALGERHPRTATSLNTLANVLFEVGEYEEAASYYQRGVELQRAAFGDQDSLAASRSRFNLGLALSKLGDLDAAERELVAARDDLARRLGASHPNTIGGEIALAGIAIERGRVADAEVMLNAALERASGDQPSLRQMASFAGHVLGIALARRGSRDQAEAMFARSESELAALVSIDDRQVAAMQVERAANALVAGRTDDAVRLLEHAVSVLVEDCPPDDRGRAKMLLARALWASPAARERSRSLAAEADALLTRAGRPGARYLAELRAWTARAGIAPSALP